MNHFYMKLWHINELANIAGISIRTLHHYDKIGLLKASRQKNNQYRVYDLDNLKRLEQILGLKALGFDLKKIKEILQKKVNLEENLQNQLLLLEAKEESLNSLKSKLKEILTNKSFYSSNDLSVIFDTLKQNQIKEESILSAVLSEKQISIIKHEMENFLTRNKQVSQQIKDCTLEMLHKNLTHQAEIQKINEQEIIEILSEEEHYLLKEFQLKKMEELKNINREELMFKNQINYGKLVGKIYGNIIANLSQEPTSLIGKLLAQLWLDVTSNDIFDPKIQSIQLKLFEKGYGSKAASFLLGASDAQKSADHQKKLVEWIKTAISFHNLKPLV